MTLLARIRFRHMPLARALVALFAAGWLMLALQPCQAMGRDEPAQPGHDHARAGHADHHDLGTGTGGDPVAAGCDTPCPHCPTDSPEDCTLGSALECTVAGLTALPAKKAGVQAFDAVTWHAAPALPAIELALVLRVPDRPDPGGVRPPSTSLQQRYCTYLK
jgi:hypothetical protein